MRIRKYLDFKKIRIIFKEFSEAQFKYYPLMSMFCSKSTNRRINHLHERALRLTYDDYELTLRNSQKKMNHLPYIITIFRSYVLNYIKCTITCHTLFSAICLDETSILIIYAWNSMLSFHKSEHYWKNQTQSGIMVQ